MATLNSKITIPGVTGRKTGFSRKVDQLATVDDWFLSSEESASEDEKQPQQQQSMRKSLVMDNLSIRKSGSYTLDMDLVDSFEDSAAETIINTSILNSPLRKSISSRINGLAGFLNSDDEQEEEEEFPSQRSNKENVTRGEAAPVKTIQSAKRKSLAKNILEDITPEEVLEEDEVERVESPAIKPRRKSISFRKDSTPPAQKKLGIETSDNESEQVVEERRKSVAVEPVDKESVQEDLAPAYDDYEEGVAEDYEEPAVQDDIEEEVEPVIVKKSVAKAPKERKSKPKSILKQTAGSESLDGLRMPKELARPSLEVKIFEKGGYKEVETEEGIVKRSARQKYAPLDYWRNEKVRYGRRKSGLFPVPVIQEIVRVPEEAPVLRKKRKSKKKYVEKIEAVTFLNPFNDEEIKDDLMIPGEQETYFQEVNGSGYKVAKFLRDPFEENIFSGMMLLPKGSEKPPKLSGDFTIFGFVHSGDLDVRIHETSHVISKGGSFVIPKGNMYSFKNKGSRDASVFIVNDKRPAVSQ